MQAHIDCIRRIGKEYGLELNDAKLEVLAINAEDSITNANGIRIEPKERRTYLGALLSYDGRIAFELTRRIGMASLSLWIFKNMESCKCQQGQEIDDLSRVHYPEAHVRIAILLIEPSRAETFRWLHYKCMRRILKIFALQEDWPFSESTRCSYH